MKRVSVTKNRVRRQAAVGVSLFPFLAVLICTMGALILLLVIIARQARLQAAEETALKTNEIRDELQTTRQWAQLEIQEYKAARQKTEKELVDTRLALGHVEDHARRLRDQLAQLEATWTQLETEADGSQQRGQLEAELQRLKTRIAETERELAEALSKSAEHRGSYAVVPYQGPNETERRPIYIECLEDSVVLRPEGIVLNQNDFAGPLGPGNPLDVALRAKREYLLKQNEFTFGDLGEPYPLLLIRPGGIEAYYVARAALKSWASEFGYELIGQDWQLEYEPLDPTLAEQMAGAIRTARARQEMLIAAAPSIFNRGPQTRYVASAYHGGLVPDGGSAESEHSGYPFRQPFGRGTSGGAGRDTRGFDDGDEDRFGSGRATFAEGNSTSDAVASHPSGSREHDVDGQGAAEASGSSRRLSPDEDEAGIAYAGDQTASLADTRGGNWGLPNAANGSVPITSPIRIDCHPHRLILVPEKRLSRGKTIPLGPRTQDAIDEFVSAVWEYMELWGSAGNGMYWRPVLSVHVAPGAESRYHDLKTLLEGSGLGVEKSGRKK